MNEGKGNTVLNSKKVYDDVKDALKKMAEKIAKDFNVDLESAYGGIRRAADYATSNKYSKAFNEAEDHEVGMAMGQLQSIHSDAAELENKIGEVEKDIPAWIQSHITSAYEYLKQANDNFHELEENIAPGNIGGMGAVLLPTATQPGSGDIPATSGDAEEDYKKKKKKMDLRKMNPTKTFAQYVAETKANK